MLKKRAKGTRTLLKCEKCGKKVSTLYDGNDGKKVCAQCLENSGK